MNLVDSCGWLEYFSGGANADFFEAPLKDTNNLLVPSICIYEVFKKILVERGEDPAFQAIGVMNQGKIVVLDLGLAIQSAKISHEYKIPFADSVILASARYYDAVIWTQDEHFKNIKSVKYISKK
jgi:toxin FitB